MEVSVRRVVGDETKHKSSAREWEMGTMGKRKRKGQHLKIN